MTDTRFVPGDDLIFVDGAARGSRGWVRPVRMVLDTAASYTILTPAVIADVGYEHRDFGRRTRTRSVVGEEPGRFMIIEQLECLGFAMPRLTVVVQKLHADMDGLLGLNFLKQLDYAVLSMCGRVLAELARPAA